MKNWISVKINLMVILFEVFYDVDIMLVLYNCLRSYFFVNGVNIFIVIISFFIYVRENLELKISEINLVEWLFGLNEL